MSTGVDGWCGWRQLIQCIWGDASRAEYKQAAMPAVRNAEGPTWATVASAHIHNPRAAASHVINQAICFPPAGPAFESKAAYERGGMENCIRRYWATASLRCRLPFSLLHSHCPVSSLVAHLCDAIRCRFQISLLCHLIHTHTHICIRLQIRWVKLSHNWRQTHTQTRRWTWVALWQWHLEVRFLSQQQ